MTVVGPLKARVLQAPAGGVSPLRIRETHDYRRFSNDGKALAAQVRVTSQVPAEPFRRGPGTFFSLKIDGALSNYFVDNLLRRVELPVPKNKVSTSGSMLPGPLKRD